MALQDTDDIVKSSTLLTVAIGDQMLKRLVEQGTLMLEFQKPTVVTLQLSLSDSVKAVLAPQLKLPV